MPRVYYVQKCKSVMFMHTQLNVWARNLLSLSGWVDWRMFSYVCVEDVYLVHTFCVFDSCQ